MVYEWEQHREICYELYVEQNKSLDEVAQYLRLRYNFTPSRRAYQIKFSYWKFPAKQSTGFKDPRLVERVKELWQKNLTDSEMIRILVEEEEFEIDRPELATLRRKLGLRLREPGIGFGLNKPGQKKRKHSQRQASPKELQGDSAGDSDGGSSEDPRDSEDESEGEQEGGAKIARGPGPGPAEASLAISVPALSRQELAAAETRREQRKREFEVESRERWATKKRRRRTKPYAGLPADPPCPPRFPSETTLEEAKTILQLDAEAYKTLRKTFQTICEQAGVMKKTIAGPEKWESLKEQLIRESIHLRSCMWDKNDIDKKKLAIDIIANDVTKRMRVTSTQLNVSSAKTILNLDPDQGRQIRAALYAILAQEGFTSKSAEGAEHWNEIKRKWYASSELLTRLGTLEQPDGDGTADQDRPRKVKALALLARDATRRYREDAWCKGKNVRETLNSKGGAKQTPATGVSSSTPEESDDAAQLAPLSSVVSSPATPVRRRPAAKSRAQPARRVAQARGIEQQAQPPPQHHTDSRLAPLPTAGAVNLSSQLDTTQILLPPQPQHSFVTNHQYTVPVQSYAPAVSQAASVYHQHQHQHQHQPHAPQPQSTSMAVFFKLHPGSALSMVGPTMWISTIGSRSSIAEVRAAAVEKYPGAICFAIEGMVKDGKGGELPLPVNDEMELEVYLQHISGNANVTGHSQAPTFVVQLMV